MSARIVLECSHEQFHALHVAVDGARDHGKLVGEFRSELEGVL